MIRSLVLGVAVAFAAMVFVSCSSNGDGSDGQTALSFNTASSIPAAGGAAIGATYGTGFGSVISSMLSALASDVASESSASRQKILVDEALPICVDGSAILNGELREGGTATLALTDCTGSPLSEAAANGRIVLSVTSFKADLPNDMSAAGTAELAGLEDEDSFTIGSSFVVTGGFSVDALISLSLPMLDVSTIELALGAETTEDRVLVEATGRTLELACFRIATIIRIEPPAIEGFEPKGVLSLDGHVYALNDVEVVPNISFGSLTGGTAVPTAGGMTLTSGESGGCFPGATAGDTSSATLTFVGDGNVRIESMGADGQCFDCTQPWEGLLETLTTSLFPPCPSVSCEGGRRDPVINYVRWEYPDVCPGLGETTLIVEISAYDDDVDSDELIYTGTVSGCDDISVEGRSSPVEEELNCFAGSLTLLSVTVTDPGDPEGREAMLEVSWESAICEEGCVEGEGRIEERCDR